MIALAVERYDLLGYLREHGATPTQTGEWALTCPICGKEKLIVNETKKTWHCWVCQSFEVRATPTGPRRVVVAGAGGLLDLIQLLDRCDRRRAVEMVLAAGITSKDLMEITDTRWKSTGAGSEMEPSPIPPPPGWVSIDQPLPYMRQRGISMDDVRRLGIFWCALGQYANRLCFPVWEDGRLLYWQARAMWAEIPGQKYVKALNPPKTPGAAVSSDLLMGLHHARSFDRVVITEGPIDAIHVGPDAVAAFGKALSPMQLRRLWRAGVRALDLMLDHDARSDMVAYAPVLAPLFDLRLIYLPWGDPGEWKHEDLVQLRRQAVPVDPQSKLRRV